MGCGMGEGYVRGCAVNIGNMRHSLSVEDWGEGGGEREGGKDRGERY